MNIQSNAVSASVDAQAAPAALSATRPWYWSVRRELMEYRFLYLAPLGVAVAFLFAFAAVLPHHLPHEIRGATTSDAMQYREALALPYDIAGGLMMLVGILMSIFYCSDALHGERRDRSILFWKSLPVSDRTTVLSKAMIPFVILPIATFAVAVAVQWVMILVSSVIALGSGVSVSRLWSELAIFQMWPLLLYHLLTVHTLSPAPFYGWLMLVSAWARRAAFLWAVLPLLAISILEKIIFNSAHFAMILLSRLTGSGAEAADMPGVFPTNPMTHITPGVYLTSPGLWIGLAVTALCLALAIRVRRYRGPI